MLKNISVFSSHSSCWMVSGHYLSEMISISVIIIIIIQTILCVPLHFKHIKTSIKIWPKADIADMEALHPDIRKLILQMIEKKVVSML